MVGQSHLRRKPELGFAINVRNMHMNTRLFTRKEEETKLTVANNGWCHAATLTNFLSSRLTISVYLPRGKAGRNHDYPFRQINHVGLNR
jgi:hypothetical protein